MATSMWWTEDMERITTIPCLKSITHLNRHGALEPDDIIRHGERFEKTLLSTGPNGIHVRVLSKFRCCEWNANEVWWRLGKVRGDLKLKDTDRKGQTYSSPFVSAEEHEGFSVIVQSCQQFQILLWTLKQSLCWIHSPANVNSCAFSMRRKLKCFEIILCCCFFV